MVMDIAIDFRYRHRYKEDTDIDTHIYIYIYIYTYIQYTYIYIHYIPAGTLRAQFVKGANSQVQVCAGSSLMRDHERSTRLLASHYRNPKP